MLKYASTLSVYKEISQPGRMHAEEFINYIKRIFAAEEARVLGLSTSSGFLAF